MIPDFVKLKEIKPVLCGFIREAQFRLDPDEIPDENVVHDIRVLMKRSRATIRLLKSQMDEESFIREYSALREVGRIMRSWRETSVHRKLLKYLKKKYPELFTHLTDNEKINLLLNKPDPEKAPSPEMKKDIENIMGLLHKSDYRWRFRSMNNLDPHLLLKELEITFNSASFSYLKARNYPTSVNVHEFRKITKDFLYQLWYFRSLKPKVIKDLEKRLENLAQNLGKYNDHSVLIKTLDYKYPSPDNSSAADELAVLIKGEQDRYLMKVWPAAFRIFRPGKNLVSVLGFKVTEV
jgi:CHAD domain-containing protein